MRNTRQVPLGSEGSEAPALQQIMETMIVFLEANEKYRREQEQIREEAKAEQERLRAEARADQERLQACLMAKIVFSRMTMEKHA